MTGKSNTGAVMTGKSDTGADMTEKTQQQRAALCILTGAALWGMIGLWNRRLLAAGLSPTDIVVIRNFGGMALLSLVLLVRDRAAFRIDRACIPYFFGTGVISVLFFTICYFSCQKICSLSVASVLLYTAPSFVVLMSAALWKEPVTRRKLLALALTLFGCILVCGLLDGGGLTVTAAGALYGLGAGFFYALYSIFGRYALASASSMTVTLWTFLFAGGASLIFFRPSHMAPLASPVTLGAALGLVVFSTVLPYLFYTAGLAHTEAGKASIMASLEPVVASLTGLIVFQEAISLTGVIGILFVLAGVYILR